MKINCATLMTLCDGRSIDLLAPKVEDIDFKVTSHHLAQINRYGGAALLPYSVGDHLINGARNIRKSGGSIELQRAWLLHDKHEFAIGDAITPLKRALGQLALANEFALSDSLGELYRLLAYRFDVVIHEAAGVPWPLPIKLQQQVEYWDVRMLRTEWRDLMVGEAPFAWPDAIAPCADKVAVSSWQEAREELTQWCFEILPSLARSAA